MSSIYKSADELIGNTPLLELSHIEKAENLDAKIIAKTRRRSARKRWRISSRTESRRIYGRRNPAPDRRRPCSRCLSFRKRASVLTRCRLPHSSHVEKVLSDYPRILRRHNVKGTYATEFSERLRYLKTLVSRFNNLKTPSFCYIENSMACICQNNILFDCCCLGLIFAITCQKYVKCVVNFLQLFTFLPYMI